MTTVTAEKTFYRCEHCGNLVGLIVDGGVNPVCCGQNMVSPEANTEDASFEKHVPALTLNGESLLVKIGGQPHPMSPEHYIQWIMVSQGNHTQRVELMPDGEPEAGFIINPEGESILVYAYCNLHSLWKRELSL